MNITAYAIAVIVYGVLVAVGGLIGYLQARSKASLIAGDASGTILIVSGVLMLRGVGAAIYVALVVAFALALFFGRRFVAKRAFMPAGLMFVLSIAITVVLLSHMLRP